jgi:hypothetical protein
VRTSNFIKSWQGNPGNPEVFSFGDELPSSLLLLLSHHFNFYFSSASTMFSFVVAAGRPGEFIFDYFPANGTIKNTCVFTA